MISAAQETIQILKANGVRRIFGNPGTTELALLDATVSEGIEFHLCLHEGAAVAMADGYARATGTPGVVLVHTSVGAANTLTNLINLRSDSQPLLLIAGDKDDRLAGRGCFCEVPDLPGLLRQVCKEAWHVARPEKLPELVLRGLKVAGAPTPGPVFLSVPENVMSAALPDDVIGLHRRRATRLSLRAHPDDLRDVLEALKGATRPLFIAGNEVGATGSGAMLQELSQRLRVPIVSEQVFTVNALDVPMGELHHGNFAPDLQVVRDADLIVAFGARAFMEYEWPSAPYLAPGTRLIQIGAQASELGKIYPTEMAVLGRVDDALRELLVFTAAGGAAARAHVPLPHAAVATAQGPTHESSADAPPLPGQVLSALDRLLPADAVLVDESVLSKGMVQAHLMRGNARRYFGTSGGGLGWGLPAAMGVQLGMPEQRVVAFVGDGGALFNIQSLWTAAHLRLPLVMVVLNNAGYMAVRRGLGQFDKAAVQTDRYPGAFIHDPAVDLCQLARGFGVQAAVVNRLEALEGAVQWAFERNAPVVLDVHVASSAYY